MYKTRTNLIVSMTLLCILDRIERYLDAADVVSRVIELPIISRIFIDNSPAKRWAIYNVVILLRSDMTYTIQSFQHEDPQNKCRIREMNGSIKSIEGELDLFSMSLDLCEVELIDRVVPITSAMKLSVTTEQCKWDISLSLPDSSENWISGIYNASNGESFQSKY